MFPLFSAPPCAFNVANSAPFGANSFVSLIRYSLDRCTLVGAVLDGKRNGVTVEPRIGTVSMATTARGEL